jgi:hypothetical protein
VWITVGPQTARATPRSRHGVLPVRSGIAPRELADDETNRELNAALLATLQPVREAAEQLFSADEATHLTTEVFAHATGLLLLRHTHRLNLFRLDARTLMNRYLTQQITREP